ncbi:MAG TPA: HEAT repeat domain-containing protein [Bryobacteraceae bacterium]|nr:HEAT repeat domain-containing protein [Bryobacteraceae bacterium]
MSIQPSFADLVDPGLYSVDEAERAALQLMQDGQRIPERFALALQSTPPPDLGRAERMLQLLPRITRPERLLPLLDLILPTSNTRIRSKAWKLYAEASADLAWALEQIRDPDPRVAANVVEALWRATPSAELQELFRHAAQQDRNRVAGNGLVGLFTLHDPEAAEWTRQMARHADPAFRATAAWVAGRVYWQEGIAVLRELMQDSSEKVRRNAKRSILRLGPHYPGAA